jgi:hypothetical protein
LDAGNRLVDEMGAAVLMSWGGLKVAPEADTVVQVLVDFLLDGCESQQALATGWLWGSSWPTVELPHPRRLLVGHEFLGDLGCGRETCRRRDRGGKGESGGTHIWRRMQGLHFGGRIWRGMQNRGLFRGPTRVGFFTKPSNFGLEAHVEALARVIFFAKPPNFGVEAYMEALAGVALRPPMVIGRC